MTSLSTPLAPLDPPDTTDFLAYHALQSPEKVAIGHNAKTYNYRQVHHDLLCVTAGLKKLGVLPGQLALVHQSNPYAHVLLLLACEKIRVATASLPLLSPSILYKKADLLLSETPSPNLPLSAYLVDDAWLARALATPLQDAQDESPTQPSMEDVLRVTRSSGTTGEPKLMQICRWQFESSVQGFTRDRKISADTVMMVAYGMDILSIWTQLVTCLRNGGTALWGDPETLSEKFNFTHWWLLPLALSNLLKKLPVDWEKPRGLTIYTAGAPLSENLRNEALNRLCDEIVNGYGANETGGICRLDFEGKGVLRAGVKLQVVDEEGHPVPLGEEGLIAVRSPEMVQEYWQQPEQTAKYFKDGWFYPGDRGKLLSPRVLQHLGRADEMLNFGGIKQPPELIESYFMRMSVVTEAAATTIIRSDGADVLLLALVLKDGTALPKIKQIALSQLKAFCNQIEVIACDSLPRTPNGKIRRNAIRELLARSS